MKGGKMQEYPYIIGGEFKKSDKKLEVVNPYDEKIFAYIYETSPQDIKLAVKEAKSSQKIWKKTPFKERGYVLREISKIITQHLQELASLESKEIGKVFKESLFVDIVMASSCFDYYASFIESLSGNYFSANKGIDLIQYQPFGVVGVFLPYNVPVMIFGFTVSSILAAGNSVIVKPSEYGSLSILKLVEYITKLDIPKGLINVITGKGETVGATLVREDIDLISFTGSRETLSKIYQNLSFSPKKIICELGGCNLTLILEDAQFDDALENVVGSSFMKQGQMCIGTSVVLIQESIYEKFIDSLIEKVSKIKIGDPFDPEVGLGPLPTYEHLLRLQERINSLKKEGCKILYGGEIPDTKGFFYLPTIVEIPQIKYEEFFAPVILVKKFKTREELNSIVENNPTGLVLQVWTQDLKWATSFAENVDCGQVWINTFAQMDCSTPFGGCKKSGWGRNLGKWGFFEYVQIKHVGIGLEKSPVWGWFGV